MVSCEFNSHWRQLYYCPQRSCGKVIFSQASVILSTGRGTDTRWVDTPQQTSPSGRHPSCRNPHADTPHTDATTLAGQAPPWADTSRQTPPPPWADTPGQTTTHSDTPGRHPQADFSGKPPWADTPRQTPHDRHPRPLGRHPGQTPLPSADDYHSVWYASYWNAFLFFAQTF